jgi:hypothetical protein
MKLGALSVVLRVVPFDFNATDLTSQHSVVDFEFFDP